jgi:alpha-D-ribose 1-methylphosphonate 5-triphosphate synthase subunit PhnH
MNLIATARLTGHSSQRVFDVLLQTLAEPGRTLQLPVSTVHPEIPMSTWLALALADVDVAVSIEDDPVHPTARLVADATRASMVHLETASIIGLSHLTHDRLDRIPTGSALAPEDGAKVGLLVEELREHAEGDTIHSGLGAVRLDLRGPGIPGSRSLWVRGLDSTLARRLGTATGVHPCGFDTWLFTPEGYVAAIARTTAVLVTDTNTTDTNTTDTKEDPWAT